MAKEKAKLFLTGKGVAVYPRLDTPDTKFKAEGKFSVKLKQSAEAGEALKRRIDQEMQAIFKSSLADLKEKAADSDSTISKKAKVAIKKHKMADAPYSEDDDTGEITFSFGMTASGVSKKTGKAWTRSPAIFDSKGVALKQIPKIGGGSTLNVSYEMSPFFTSAVGAGVSLRLSAVQILDLVEWSGGDAKSYGFEKTEGYEAEEGADSPFTPAAPAASDETDDDDDAAEEDAEDGDF